MFILSRWRDCLTRPWGNAMPSSLASGLIWCNILWRIAAADEPDALQMVPLLASFAQLRIRPAANAQDASHSRYSRSAKDIRALHCCHYTYIYLRYPVFSHTGRLSPVKRDLRRFISSRCHCIRSNRAWERPGALWVLRSVIPYSAAIQLFGCASIARGFDFFAHYRCSVNYGVSFAAGFVRSYRAGVRGQ